MQESTEPSSTKSVASEAQCDPANRARSESRNAAPQRAVRPTLSRSLRYQDLIPVTKKRRTEEETEDEAVDKANSPGEEHMTGEGAYHELEQKTTKKEPVPSEITLAEVRKAIALGVEQRLTT